MSKRGTGTLSILYGINAVTEAIGSRPVEHVLVTEGHHGSRIQSIIDACRAAGVSVRFAPRVALERAAGTPQHQNVVAFCAARDYDDLATLIPSANPGTTAGNRTNQPPLLVVLDGVEDPANLGAVVRTTVAAGATGIVIPERRAAGLSPAVARSAAGALEHVRIARVTNLVRALIDLKDRGLWVYGFEPAASSSYLDMDYGAPCALVFGGEGQGIHRLVRESCDRLARIPLRGPVQSLNISVAAGIVLYEAARQRDQIATEEPG
jgi:23S rRNA (guanosine2251-2'-O)-methyltransferase